MPAPTLRGLGLLVLALGAYVGGRVVGTYELYLTAIALGLLFLVSAGLVLLSGTRLGLHRSLQPERPVAGDRATEVLRLRNGSRLPTVGIRVSEPLAPMTGEDVEVDFGPLAPRAAHTRMETLPRVRRGAFTFPPARATLVDPLGLATWTHRVGGELSLTVLPRIAELRSCVFFGQRDPGEGRAIRNPLGHGSYEFRGVRPHQPGEPLNRIHWKSTAKQGTLMLRESDDPAMAGVSVVIDGHQRSVVGHGPYDTFEAAVAAAGSIGDYVLREGFALDLHLHEARSRSFRFGGTRPDRRNLLEALATATPDAPATVRDFLQRSEERLLRGLALVVMTPVIDRGLALMLRRLREKGLPVYLVHIDGPSFARAASPTNGDSRATAQQDVAAAQEKALLLNLNSARVPSATIRWGDDLAEVLSYGPASVRAPAAQRRSGPVISRKLLLLLAFTGLAIAAALTVDRVVNPPLTADLLVVAIMGVATGLPGLIDRRLAPVSALLLPLTGLLLVFLLAPAPEGVTGLSAHLTYYGEELRYGLRAYAGDIFPLSLSGVPGLRLLVLVWVYGLVGGASYLALVHGRVLMATGALFALIGMCLTVDEGTGGTVVILAFLLLVVLVLLTSQSLGRRAWGMADALAGLMVGAVSLVLAVLVLSSAPGIAAQGWQDWREWDPLGGARDSQLVFNWRQNYPRLLDPQHNVPLMRVTSPTPSYWRANTLDVFTGDSWLSAGSFEEAIGTGPGTIAVPAAGPTPPGEKVEQQFHLGDLATNYLFTGGQALEVRLRVPAEIQRVDSGALRSSTVLGPSLSYAVQALVPKVEPQRLVGLGRDYPREALPYLALQLPTLADIERLKTQGRDWQRAFRRMDPISREFSGLYQLNQRIVGDATDPYEQTLRIETYLRTNYAYSLQPPASRFVSPFAAFLFDTKIGYCQHFAGSMALLLRFNGIPARVAVGFITGKTVGPDTYLVSSNDAHSWVEAYFPGVGWLPFDPTPGRELPVGGASATSPGFVDPFAVGQAGTTSTTLPPGASAGPSQPLPEDVTSEPATPAGSGGRSVALAVVAGSGLTLLLLWPLVLRLRRQRALHRGSLEQRLAASLRLLRFDLSDGGLPISAASTLEETSAIVSGRLGVEMDDLVKRAQAVLFGGYPAGDEDLSLAESVRAQARRKVRRRMGWSWTVAGWYGYAGLLRRRRSRRESLEARPPWQVGPAGPAA